MCENSDMKRYESTKEQWEWIKPLLPMKKTGKRGHLRTDDWTMLNRMLWIVRNSAQWRELPEVYGHWQSVQQATQFANRFISEPDTPFAVRRD